MYDEYFNDVVIIIVGYIMMLVIIFLGMGVIVIEEVF